MGTRTRLALWIAAVAACGLSPVLWHLVAPWAGAAWQCVCLIGIATLYATTPADAIRLNPWVSKLVILAGTVAWPALCYGRATWVMAAVVVALLLFDVMHVEPEQPWDGKGRRPARFRVRWSWRPGFMSDWLTPLVLWWPGLWSFLAGHDAANRPVEISIPALMLAVVWGLVVQIVFRTQPKPWPRAAILMGLVSPLLVACVTVAGFVLSEDMSR